jgi:hypothetical protein
MSLAIYYLTKARKLWGIDFKIVLQIHDAVILEAQDKYAKVIKEEILPWAMCTKVPIWPRALDGKPIAVYRAVPVRDRCHDRAELGCGSEQGRSSEVRGVVL